MCCLTFGLKYLSSEEGARFPVSMVGLSFLNLFVLFVHLML